MKKLWLILALSLTLNAAFLAREAYYKYLQSTLFTDERMDKKNRRIDLLKNSEKSSGGIIFAGDSLTEEGNWEEYFKSIRIKNRGVSGARVDHFLRNSDLILSDLPDKVFLLIGINDLWQGENVEHTLREYSDLIKNITASLPKGKVYVLSLLPVREDMLQGLKNEKIREFNTGLAKLAQSLSLTYLDLHSAMTDPLTGQLSASFTVDGIHLTADGYAVWSKLLKSYL